jgi:Rps23 Pro-64 3,4-dihydroxylase Tpa1-like proline 4-hydroxylase
MKLIFNLDNKLIYIQNFLPNHEYKRIHNEIFKQYKKLNLESVSNVVDKKLIQNLIPSKRIEIHEDYFKFYKTLLFHQPFLKFKNLLKYNFFIYVRQKNSGINWHHDNHVDYGVTYYLNKRWNNNWGGEFMYSYNNQNGFIPVVGNSLIIVKTPLMHKVNPILVEYTSRISIQSFIKC